MLEEGAEAESVTAISAAALREMGRRAIDPTPQNYAVWFLYCAGTNSGLEEAIDLVTEKGVAFGDPLNKTLYDSFCLGEDARLILARCLDVLDNAADRFTTSLDAVGANVATYDQTLGSFEAAVSDAQADPSISMSKLVAETRTMRLENARLQAELAQATAEVATMKTSFDGAAKETRTDRLTQIGNRKTFDESLNAAVQAFRAGSGTFTVVMVDIDDFKKFNDVHGHQVGDEVLKLVARALADNVRDGDTVARYGGEEFALILPVANLSAGRAVAEKLRLAMASRRLTRRGTGEDLGGITFSLGVAEIAPDESADSLIGRADAALYEAKRAGRNCVCVAAPHVQRHVARRANAEASALA